MTADCPIFERRLPSLTSMDKYIQRLVVELLELRDKQTQTLESNLLRAKILRLHKRWDI